MAYATQQDMIDAKGLDAVLAVADRTHSGAPDAGAITDALDAASTQMDGYMSERFDLPLATPPSWGKRICIDLAMYILADSGGTATETIEKRNDAAVKFMEGVSRGLVGLGLPTPQMPQGDESGEIKGGDVLIESNERVFGNHRRRC
jgi:phage gp36-like protein